MDNGSSRFAEFLKHDHLTLLSKKSSDLKQYFQKHNIRKINIRSLSDLLCLNTTMSCSSDDMKKYTWAKYFNPDCTFSTNKFQQDYSSTDSNRTKELISLKKQLLDCMIALDKLLFANSSQYKGPS